MTNHRIPKTLKFDNCQSKIGHKEAFMLSAVLPHITQTFDPKRINFHGDMIKMNTKRLNMFKSDDCKCSVCNATAAFFIKDRHFSDELFHLNLYRIGVDSQAVLYSKRKLSKTGKHKTVCAICILKLEKL